MKFVPLLALPWIAACGGATSATPAEPYDLEGPGHPVGVMTLDLVDASREGGRRLPTEVWYPALRAEGTPESTVDGAPVAHRGAPALRKGAPWPVIVFSHGHRGVPGQSTFLTHAWASRGYVVAAMAHTGNTTLDNQGTEQSAIHRPDDASFVLTQVLDGADGALVGLVDPARVGLAGHSFGAWTTLVTTAADDRFKAALPISPGRSETPGVTKELGVPTMIIIGTEEAGDRYTQAKELYERLGPPRYLVGIEGAGHGAFTDVCGHIDTPELTQDGCSPQWRDPDDVQAVTRRLAVPFFDHYVAGVAGAAALFDEDVLMGESLGLELAREL